MTQTTQTHTATPLPFLKLQDEAPKGSPSRETRCIFGNGQVIADICTETGEDLTIAYGIVEACNAHARLLSENKALREALEEYVNAVAPEVCTKERAKARAALSLSQVKP